MGEVIQGPWKKRTPRQIIEHEMLIIAQSAQQELSPDDQSRRPVASLFVRPAPVGKPQH